MGTASEHVFHSKQASPALIAAVKELSARKGEKLENYEGQTLGEIFEAARSSYGEDLPEFWRIWNDWNTAPEDPAPWGEL